MINSPLLRLCILLVILTVITAWGSTAFAQDKPTYMNPYDITLGETLPEKYAAVDCKQIKTEGAQDLEQCLVTPDLSRKVDIMKIVRLKSTSEIYIVQAIKNASSEDEARRFAGNEYARAFMSYKPKITEGGTVHNQEFTGWETSKETTRGTLVDEERSVIVDFRVESDRSVINYVLLAFESEKSIEELIDHIGIPPKQ